MVEFVAVLVSVAVVWIVSAAVIEIMSRRWEKKDVARCLDTFDRQVEMIFSE